MKFLYIATKNHETFANKIFPQQTNTVRCVSFQLQQTETTSTSCSSRSEPDSSRSVIIDFNYTYRSACIRRAHRPLCSFPHVERVHLRRPLLQWLEERGKKRAGNTTEPTDTIFIYCCVCLCFIMSRRGDRGARWGKKRQRKRVAFKWRNAGGGRMGWGRWDSRMTLLVGDLYPLVEWPSSRGKIYRISEALS